MKSEKWPGIRPANLANWQFGPVTITRWSKFENLWLPESSSLAKKNPELHERLTAVSPRHRFPVAVIDIDGEGKAARDYLESGLTPTEALLMLHRNTGSALAAFAREVVNPRSPFSDIQYIVGTSRLALPGLVRFGWQVFDLDVSFHGTSHQLAEKAHLQAGSSLEAAKRKAYKFPSRLAIMSREQLIVEYGGLSGETKQ